MAKSDTKSKSRKRLKPVHRNIRRLREELGLSQSELAVAIDRDIDKSWISHWERGRLTPTVDLLPNVAAALGVSVDDLLAERAA